MTRRLLAILCLVGAALAALLSRPADAATRRVEVIEVSGIIDSSVERAILSNITQGEREHVQAVIVQIDSRGAVGEERGSRIIDRIRTAKVPVVVWVPSGGHSENSAVFLLIASSFSAMAPSATVGPVKTFDLQTSAGAEPVMMVRNGFKNQADLKRYPFDQRISATTAERRDLVDAIAPSLPDLLDEMNGKHVKVNGKTVKLATSPNRVIVRVHKLDLFGRILHAAAQPSVAYLLILAGLVGIVFELFHPSTGPAGVTGLAGFAFGLYGVAALGGSWAALVAIVVGVTVFCIDLRFERLGGVTIVGAILLVAGSLWLFHGPYLRISPWIIAFGIASMVAFLLGAMTRVLRDLRAIARGELEVRDAHPHPEIGDAT